MGGDGDLRGGTLVMPPPPPPPPRDVSAAPVASGRLKKEEELELDVVSDVIGSTRKKYMLLEPEIRTNFVDGSFEGGGLGSRPVGRRDAVVIDLGSSEVRAGYASSFDPCMRFPPLISRARDPGPDGRRRNFIGYDAMHTSVRSGARSPFELNVPFNATLLERLLDGTITSLGLADDTQIDRPFVLTEPVCQLNGARAPLMEILFEGYHAEKVCLGVDAMFSYMHNTRHRSNQSPNALVLSSSFKTTHVLPIVNGRLYASAAKRINVGTSTETVANCSEDPTCSFHRPSSPFSRRIAFPLFLLR